MTELKCSVYLNDRRMANQAAGVEAFKAACVSSHGLLLAVLHEVFAGRLTPEKAAEALGCDLTPRATDSGTGECSS